MEFFNLLPQMGTLYAAHIVFMRRIDEIVHLFPLRNALRDKLQGMLPQHRTVPVSYTHLTLPTSLRV